MLVGLTLLFLFYSCVPSKNGTQSSPPDVKISASQVKDDTAKKSISRPKPYKEVITANAITSKGLFTIHKIEERYYFEIPDSLLGKDLLTVNRISKAAAGNRPFNGNLGLAGDEIGENVIQFIKSRNDKIFFKRISFQEISNDSSANGMYRSVQNSNLQPIVASFDIKAIGPDSLSSVIDVTDFLNNDNDILFFNAGLKKVYALGTIQPDKSYTQSMLSFPVNVEIKTVKTYFNPDLDNFAPGHSQFNTYLINSSIVLLPAKLMKPRYADDRVGYFTVNFTDFDQSQEVKTSSLITRWRLEPKQEDVEKYKRGELAEPQHPIVFYIDPVTPQKWVPYLIQGVNAWEKAFEKAGFKNAIHAEEAPKNDSTWSLEDARHNVIMYKASEVENANGPNVHDPRTGEILESHINWYHNIVQLLHDWYMIQVGLDDPKGRAMQFDDELMGKLIQYVCTHEVGHTLGLLHNFGASATVPVDKLRDKKWVSENGICPSIMDYARFNYVAQPEDSIATKDLINRIGVYDEWAIEWGYKWLPDIAKKEEEKTYMNKWIIDRTSKNKMLWFGSQQNSFDPRCQAEDLGDDAIKASYCGIKNLKRLLPLLQDWTRVANSDYKELYRMRNQAISQYKRYMWLVEKNMTAIEFDSKTIEQKEIPLHFVSREKQKEAIKFLHDELFTTPDWMLLKKQFLYYGGNPFELTNLQEDILHDLLIPQKFVQLFWFEATDPENCYHPADYLNDVTDGIWSELKNHQPITNYRRYVQKACVYHLINSMAQVNEKNLGSTAVRCMDAFSLYRSKIQDLVKQINNALPYYKDEIIKAHLTDVRQKFMKALDPNANILGSNTYTGKEINNDFNRIKLIENHINQFDNWNDFMKK
jgi:hypothetical protein